MLVTHEEASVTHAVMGGLDAIECGITGDAHFMHMLSASLYKNQKLAMVREVLCNAWDAHIMVDKTERVQVTCDNEELIIQDFGPGIHHDMIGPIYGVYGASTKKNDGKQTGGFGLGCKSPWSYVDTFEVTSCHQGKKAIYQMAKSSAERQGKPSIKPIVVDLPTTETGITVKIRLKSSDDAFEILKYIKQVLYYGGIPAKLNGDEFKHTKHDTALKGWAVVPGMGEHGSAPIRVLYGNVTYPITSHPELDKNLGEIQKFIKSLPTVENGYVMILHAPPDSLAPTPSREELTMIDMTVETLKVVTGNFVNQLMQDGPSLVKERVIARLEAQAQLDHTELLAFTDKVPNPYSEKVKLIDDSGWRSRLTREIVDLGDLVDLSISHTYPGRYMNGFREFDTKKRLELLEKAGGMDKRLLREFKQTLDWNYAEAPTQAQRSFVTRHVTGWVIRQALKKDASINPKNLFLTGVGKNEYGSYRGYKSDLGGSVVHYNDYLPTSMTACVPFLYNRVVLTHSRTTIRERMRMHKDFIGKTDEFRKGFLIYLVPRSARLAAEAMSFFQSIGMNVIDMLQIHDWEHACFKPQARTTVAPELRKPKVKKTGHICLSGAIGFNGMYDPYRARDNVDGPRIDKPEFVVTLQPKGRYGYDTSLGAFRTNESEIICRLFGKYGAIIQQSKVLEKLLGDGVLTIEEWVAQRVLKEMTTNKRIHTNWTVSSRILIDIPEYDGAMHTVTDVILSDQPLRDHFGLGIPLDQRDSHLLFLWEQIHGDMDRYYGRFSKLVHNKVLADGYKKMAHKLDSIKPAPALVSLVQKLEGNIPVQMFNAAEARRVLNSTAPDRVIHHTTIRNMLIKAIDG